MICNEKVSFDTEKKIHGLCLERNVGLEKPKFKQLEVVGYRGKHESVL